MVCPVTFKLSPGSFFAPLECSGCKLLKAENTSLRGAQVYFCSNVSAYETYQARVTDVLDGDTILVKLGLNEKVRLLGIDAPETGAGDKVTRQCQVLGVTPEVLRILGKIATLHLLYLCPKGSTVTIKTTDPVRDEFYRILAGVFVNGACLNRCMVEDGYAMAMHGNFDWEYYGDLDQQAKDAGKGIWSGCEEPFYKGSGKNYHRPGCMYARWSKTTFITRTEAQSAGLEPCSVCLPGYQR